MMKQKNILILAFTNRSKSLYSSDKEELTKTPWDPPPPQTHTQNAVNNTFQILGIGSSVLKTSCD